MYTAKQVIEKLRTQYHADRFYFTMVASTLLAGDGNKKLRCEIMQELNQPLPAYKCTLTPVSEALKAHYEQGSLFTVTA